MSSEKSVALVTGGSRGIGRAIAERLAKEGHYVIINYRSNREEAEKTLQGILERGGEGEIDAFDVSKGRETTAHVQAQLDKHGHIDVLVNNAGIREDMLMIWMEEEHWNRVIDTNLSSVFHVTRPILKTMLTRRKGAIINMTSTSGEAGMAGQVNYSASKAGIIGATKALAKEVAKRQVTVNAVAPGFIASDMLEGLDEKTIKSQIPMQRLGRPEEVAALVHFLCSPEAAYITGQVIGINGGIHT